MNNERLLQVIREHLEADEKYMNGLQLNYSEMSRANQNLIKLLQERDAEISSLDQKVKVTEEALDMAASTILRLKDQLTAKYGCEDCPGLPKLVSSKVAEMAFKAVYADKPEYFKEPENITPAPNHQNPRSFETYVYGK